MKTIKRFFLFALSALFFANVHTANAQVTIGGETEPVKGATLDLSPSGGYVGGLKLPNVELTSLTEIPASFTDDATSITAANLKGLQVYNTNTTLGEGVYTWNGAKWIKGSGNLNISDVVVTRLPSTTITYTSAVDVKFATFEITEAGLYALRTHMCGHSSAHLLVYLHLFKSDTNIKLLSRSIFNTTIRRYADTVLQYLEAGSYAVDFQVSNATTTNPCTVLWASNFIEVQKLYIE